MNEFIFFNHDSFTYGVCVWKLSSNKRKRHSNAGCYVRQACGSDELINKKELFRERTGTQKSISVVPVSAGGVKTNEFSDTVQRTITGDDLFC